MLEILRSEKSGMLLSVPRQQRNTIVINILRLDPQIAKHNQGKPYSRQTFPTQAPGEDLWYHSNATVPFA